MSESRGRERDGGKEVGVDDRGIHTADLLPWRRPRDSAVNAAST